MDDVLDSFDSKFYASIKKNKYRVDLQAWAVYQLIKFGFSEEKMISRLSYTDFDGEKFMSKINLDESIDEDLIKKFAPKITEGTKRIKDWVEKA